MDRDARRANLPGSLDEARRLAFEWLERQLELVPRDAPRCLLSACHGKSLLNAHAVRKSDLPSDALTRKLRLKRQSSD